MFSFISRCSSSASPYGKPQSAPLEQHHLLGLPQNRPIHASLLHRSSFLDCPCIRSCKSSCSKLNGYGTMRYLEGNSFCFMDQRTLLLFEVERRIPHPCVVSGSLHCIRTPNTIVSSNEKCFLQELQSQATWRLRASYSINAISKV